MEVAPTNSLINTVEELNGMLGAMVGQIRGDVM
jgi:hypothetical protein